MSDIFTKDDARRLLAKKTCVLIGDSIMRDIYKDLVHLVSSQTGNELTPVEVFRRKGEPTVCGDKRLKFSGKRMGRDYEETREYYHQSADVQLIFFFTTRCHHPKLVSFINNFENQFGTYPDVILMSSALWDINRWGPHGASQYRGNLQRTFHLFKQKVPLRTQIIWMTTPPICTAIKSRFLINQLRFQTINMRFLLYEANHCAAYTAAAFRFDVLDMHYHFFHQVLRHSGDGIHWNPDAIRMQANLVMSHITLSRPDQEQLPKNWDRRHGNRMLHEAIDAAGAAEPDYVPPHPRAEEVRRRIAWAQSREEEHARRQDECQPPNPKRPRF